MPVSEGCLVGEPRNQAQDPALLRCIELHVLRHLGPRPDHAHVPSEHIEQLRKLIQLQQPKPRTHRGHPRVSRHRDRPPPGCRVGPHRSKLPQPERSATMSHAGLSEEYWPAVICLHDEREEQE